MKYSKEKNTGITLIALVITIILLLILAGVTVSMLTGDNNMINQANNAKSQSDIAADKEIIEMALVEAMGKNKHGEINEENLKESLKQYNVEIIKKGSNFSIKLHDRNYIVNKDGDIKQYDYITETDVYWRFDETSEILYLRSTERDNNGTVYTKGQNWSSKINNSSIIKVIIEEPIAPKTAINMFDKCSSLTAIDGIENLHTENITNMEGMFAGCSSLSVLDVSNFDTSNVTSMYRMFNGCSNLTELNVSGFDTSKVTSMGPSWVVSGEGMFQNCKKITILDVSDWNVSNVKSMGNIFRGCSQLKTLDVSNWNTSNVTFMYCMFDDCSSLTKLDLSNFVTNNVGNMAHMFNNCRSLTNINVSNFDTKNVTTMSGMFNGCSGLKELNILNFNTGNVTTMESMFTGCKITTLDLSNFDTNQVKNMTNMFRSCTNLKTIYVKESFVTTNVTSSTAMFNQTPNLVGGSGTKCTGGGATYAKIDGGTSDPGYFTLKE